MGCVPCFLPDAAELFKRVRRRKMGHIVSKYRKKAVVGPILNTEKPSFPSMRDWPHYVHRIVLRTKSRAFSACTAPAIFLER